VLVYFTLALPLEAFVTVFVLVVLSVFSRRFRIDWLLYVIALPVTRAA
jgi:hypothetical protein